MTALSGVPTRPDDREEQLGPDLGRRCGHLTSSSRTGQHKVAPSAGRRLVRVYGAATVELSQEVEHKLALVSRLVVAKLLTVDGSGSASWLTKKSYRAHYSVAFAPEAAG